MIIRATNGQKLQRILIINSRYGLFLLSHLFFSIYRYATVTTNQGALIIGGTSDDSVALNTVACYNNSTWTKLDDLQTARYAHSAILNGNKVYVIGGNLTG